MVTVHDTTGKFLQQRNATVYRLVGKANEDDPKTLQTVLSITFINISSADHQMRLERFVQLRSAQKNFPRHE